LCPRSVRNDRVDARQDRRFAIGSTLGVRSTHRVRARRYRRKPQRGSPPMLDRPGGLGTP